VTHDQAFYSAILAELRAVNERLDLLLGDSPQAQSDEVELREPVKRTRKQKAVT